MINTFNDAETKRLEAMENAEAEEMEREEMANMPVHRTSDNPATSAPHAVGPGRAEVRQVKASPPPHPPVQGRVRKAITLFTHDEAVLVIAMFNSQITADLQAFLQMTQANGGNTPPVPQAIQLRERLVNATEALKKLAQLQPEPPRK